MFYLTEKSIKIANSENYLDRLSEIYPMIPEKKRVLSEGKIREIHKYFTERNNIELIKCLLGLDLFPIKDSYVAFLRTCNKNGYKKFEKEEKIDNDVFLRNPNTVDRLSHRLYDMGIDEIIRNSTLPKETNRQIGPMFKNWIIAGSLGYKVVAAEEFLNCNYDCILNTSEKRMMEIAKNKFNYQRNKGLDFFARKNNKYIIGETKFLTDFGGHQNAQFEDASTLLNVDASNVVKINILDGVIYLYSDGKAYKTITASNSYIFSALCLKEFLDKLN